MIFIYRTESGDTNVAKDSIGALSLRYFNLPSTALGLLGMTKFSHCHISFRDL